MNETYWADLGILAGRDPTENVNLLPAVAALIVIIGHDKTSDLDVVRAFTELNRYKSLFLPFGGRGVLGQFAEHESLLVCLLESPVPRPAALQWLLARHSRVTGYHRTSVAIALAYAKFDWAREVLKRPVVHRNPQEEEIPEPVKPAFDLEISR